MRACMWWPRNTLRFKQAGGLRHRSRPYCQWASSAHQWPALHLIPRSRDDKALRAHIALWWALEAPHVLAHGIRLASESPFLAATGWALAS
jgi:hypothetical protein